MSNTTRVAFTLTMEESLMFAALKGERSYLTPRIFFVDCLKSHAPVKPVLKAAAKTTQPAEIEIPYDVPEDQHDEYRKLLKRGYSVEKATDMFKGRALSAARAAAEAKAKAGEE